MSDPRVIQLSRVLVHYTLELQPNQTLVLNTTPLADELSIGVHAEATRVGAHVFVQTIVPGSEESFLRNASDAQLDTVLPIQKYIVECADAILNLDVKYNTRSMSGIDPARIARARSASAAMRKRIRDRAAQGELRWCVTVYPTSAMAQEADMSLADYQDFVHGAGLLDDPNPLDAWQRESVHQDRMKSWLADRDLVKIRGLNIDLTFSIKGRTFIEAFGKNNFPDGEIYTSPV